MHIRGIEIIYGHFSVYIFWGEEFLKKQTGDMSKVGCEKTN